MKNDIKAKEMETKIYVTGDHRHKIYCLKNLLAKSNQNIHVKT